MIGITGPLCPQSGTEFADWACMSSNGSTGLPRYQRLGAATGLIVGFLLLVGIPVLVFHSFTCDWKVPYSDQDYVCQQRPHSITVGSVVLVVPLFVSALAINHPSRGHSFFVPVYLLGTVLFLATSVFLVSTSFATLAILPGLAALGLTFSIFPPSVQT